MMDKRGSSSSQCRSQSVNSLILSTSLLSQNCCQAGPWSAHWDYQPALVHLAPEDRLWALSQYLLLRVTCAAQPHIPICIVSGLPADFVNDSRWEMNSSTHILCTSHMLQLHIDACHHFYNWLTEPSAHFANTSEWGCMVATFTLATPPTRQTCTASWASEWPLYPCPPFPMRSFFHQSGKICPAGMSGGCSNLAWECWRTGAKSTLCHVTSRHKVKTCNSWPTLRLDYLQDNLALRNKLPFSSNNNTPQIIFH